MKKILTDINDGGANSLHPPAHVSIEYPGLTY